MAETNPAVRSDGDFPLADPNELSMRFFVTCVVVFAAVLFVWKAVLVLSNPHFGGDAAVRMLNAGRPIARMGNRVWLPYLQLQIFGLARFEVPYAFFNLIPCVHLFIAALGLGLLGLRFLGRSRQSLLIILAFMLCFAQQPVMAHTSTMLYQEITGTALFYLLLYGGALELSKRRWLLAAGTVALLARDSMWIYLLALTAVNAKKILADSVYRRAFLFLWAIPPLWLIAVLCGWPVFNGRMPTLPTEWPLMINKQGNQAVSSLAASIQHLWDSAFRSRFVYLAAGGIAAWIVYLVESRRKQPRSVPPAAFARLLKPFTLLSLGICYGLIFLFDPWQHTAGSGRIFAAAIEQSFVWLLLIAAALRACRTPAKIIAAVALLAGAASGVDPRIDRWIPVQNPGKVEAYEEIAAWIDNAAPGRKPMACMIGDHFAEMSDFSAAIYRASHKILPPDISRVPDACDALYTTQARIPPDTGGLMRAKEYTIDAERFVLYLRPGF